VPSFETAQSFLEEGKISNGGYKFQGVSRYIFEWVRITRENKDNNFLEFLKADIYF
jgi:hypothetical protein